MDAVVRYAKIYQYKMNEVGTYLIHDSFYGKIYLHVWPTC